MLNASRRRFLQVAGVAVPSASALLSSVSAFASTDTAMQKPAVDAEGGDPSYRDLTIDEVAKRKHEVHYQEIADCYGGPMSRAPIVSVKGHPEVIWIRPDMGVGMIANPVAFALGKARSPIRWQKMERSLEKGYMPIIRSRVREESVMLEQLAYAVLLEPGAVRTGHEKQVAMLRMSVTNQTDADSCKASWWAFPGVEIKTSAEAPYKLFGDYTLFDVAGSIPEVSPGEPWNSDRTLRNGDAILGCSSEDTGVKVTRHGTALQFEVDLLPGQKKSVTLKLSSTKKGLTAAELEQLQNLDFFTGLDRRALELDATLARGTQIRVPEEAVNNIYKAQILYNQTQLVQAADRDYYMPVQGCVGFWPWEQMKQLVALDASGYHEDVAKALGYYLKLQGKRPPNADVKSYDGVFPSSATFEESGWEHDSESTIYGHVAKAMAGKEKQFPNWVNNTGSSLNAFGEHYFFSRDREWLQSVAPAMVKACDWIIRERSVTKRKNTRGEKVLEYGLLPPGQPYDTQKSQKPDYYLCVTDGYTYQGFRRIAEALVDIHHPDGARLLEEAEDYGRDISEVMRRVRQTDLLRPPYPERLSGPEAWGSFATGATSLVDVKLLDPHDAAFTQLEGYMKRRFNQGVLGLSGRCEIDDPKLKGSYYVVPTEDVYHYAWLVRGEVEKSLLGFYSALAFGVDKETLGAIERFSLYDRRYAPFFIDSSGGMRICGMIRRTLIFEYGAELRILAGAPRRWLEPGKHIEVRNAPTYFGNLDLTVKSKVGGRISADLQLRSSGQNGLREIIFRIPHPDRAQIQHVRLAGEAWAGFDNAKETITLPAGKEKYELQIDY